MFIVPISPMPSVAAMGELPKVAEAAASPAQLPFKDILGEAYKNLIETQAVSNQDAYRLSIGQADDLHNIMINSEKAATALEMTVTLTSKAVSVYNEIMRMQV